MSDEIQETLDKVYDDLKQLRDEIGLKLHLAGMDLRDQWNELESDWTNWTHQISQDLGAAGGDIEKGLREAGGEDLRKLEVKTKVTISKLKRGFKDVADKLGRD